MTRYTAAIAFMVVAATPAFAQFGNGVVVTAPGSVTQDATVEANTGVTALSVTTGLNAGWYSINGPQIGNWDQALFSGVNDQNFFTNFPGWQRFDNDERAERVRYTNTLLNTYDGALLSAHAQSTELEGEDFTGISAQNIGTPDLLMAVQTGNEINLQILRELQFQRQLLIALVTVDATKAASERNDQARHAATSASDWLF